MVAVTATLATTINPIIKTHLLCVKKDIKTPAQT